MKTAWLGRLVFGAAAVLFGIIALQWHDADTWQNLRYLWSLPLGLVIGECLMVAQIAGGFAMQHPRTAHWVAILLGVVYSIFSLTCIAGVVAAPKVYAQYGSFFEQFCLLSGAIALYAATETNPARATRFGRLGRIGLGVCAVSFTVSQIVYLTLTATLVPKWIPPSQKFWAILTTMAFGLAALALLTNLKAKLAARLLTLMIALFGVLVWIPLLVAHPKAHGNWSEIALTFLIAGAAWMVADLPSF